MNAGVERTLFIELLGGIGDLLMALPAMHAIGRSYPLARHDILTFRHGAALLAADPYIDCVHLADRGRALVSVARLLAAEHYDLIVSDTCHEGIDRLVARHGGAQHVTNLWRSPLADAPVGRRFVELLAADGVIAEDAVHDGLVYLTAAEREAAARINAGSGPLVALLVDSEMPIKRWPAARFTSLGRELCRRYRARILVVGGKAAPEAAAIAAAIGGAARVAPRASLRQFAAALAQADLAIGADTGPCRLAAAVGAPTLML
ncbi:MAG TPA: glycosyltransferase family 9 protein, partial [Gammaproteobacteria bacterium]|nr:glycosyltransferase family 9 protein [Gammaproteobacteria bacterium]